MPKRLLSKCIQKLFYQVSAEHNLKLFLAAADSAARPIRPCMAYSRSQNARRKRICARPKGDLFLAVRHRFGTVAPSRFPRLNRAPIGALPRNRLAASATGGAAAVSSDKSREKWGRVRSSLPPGAMKIAPEGEILLHSRRARNISLRHFSKILRIISIACLRFSAMLKEDEKATERTSRKDQ